MTKKSNNEKGKASSRERVVSIEAFAHNRGQVRALEEFKLRKQIKKVETAKALRSYRKVMKQQGYEAGHGASRKRVDKISTSDAEEEEHGQKAGSKRGRTKKSNPFQKAVQKAQDNKIQAENQKVEKERNEKEREKKLKQRRKRTKMLSQRTKRGQPIMKHMVDNLLVKLEKQEKR